MLYDKRWDAKVETKADPFSLEALIAWLEKQPAESKYDYYNCFGGCLFGQYAAYANVPDWYEVHVWARDTGDLYGIASGSPRTFGAALERARAALGR